MPLKNDSTPLHPPIALFTADVRDCDLALKEALIPQGIAVDLLDGVELERFINSDEPRIAILPLRDAYFPCGDLLRAIRRTPSLHTIALGDRVESTMHTRALLMGAHAYLTHDFLPEDLCGRLQALIHALRSDAPSAGEGHWQLAENKTRLLTPNGGSIGLSPSERVVMYCLMTAQGLPVRYNVLLEALSFALLPADIVRLHRLIFRLRQKIFEQWPASSPLTAHGKEIVAFSPSSSSAQL